MDGAIALLVTVGVAMFLSPVEAEDCYTAGQSHLYTGKITGTKQGYECDRWDNPNPIHRRSRRLRFPDRYIADAGNYCRDPDATGQPWCYTTSRNKRWDSCEVPLCSNIAKQAHVHAASLNDGNPQTGPTHTGEDVKNNHGKARHVVHIGVDGFVASCARDAGASNIMSRLGAQGTYTLTQALTETKTTSAPCWTAVLTGLPVEMSGVSENKWSPGHREMVNGVTKPAVTPFPTIFSTLEMQDRGATTGAFYSWAWLGNLMTKNDRVSVDTEYHSAPVRNDYGSADRRSLEAALPHLERVLAGGERSYTFLYFGNVDVTGHARGYDCLKVAEYRDAIRVVDSYVGRVLDVVDKAAGDSAVVILNSDHGGLGRKHAMVTPETLHVPLFIRGPGIRAGHQFQSQIRNLDIAPTVAAVLGIESSPFWKGQPLTEAFED